MKLVSQQLSPSDKFLESVDTGNNLLSSFVYRAFRYVVTLISKLFISINHEKISGRQRNITGNFFSPPTNLTFWAANFSLRSTNISLPTTNISLRTINISLPTTNISLRSTTISLPSANHLPPYISKSFPIDNFCVP